MTIVQRMPRFLVAIVAVALALVLAIPLTGAKGGNSAVAKACQKGGWQQLASSDDPYTAFASQDACVSHGAQGGTVVALQVESRGEAQVYCEDALAGQYLAETDRVLFECDAPVNFLDAAWNTLFSMCDDASNEVQRLRSILRSWGELTTAVFICEKL
ncbi:hypothetical protein GCM10022200_01630 [Microbacterium awajiense]|uniref:Secreted protein n=1 Tax=Microbacterium awajiense TaxID=415214 RepID=A0ABP6ZZA0_9MICO